MGGDLVAESSPAGGARFTLNLSVETGAAPRTPVPAAIPTEAPAAFAGAPLALVVDDHEVNRRVLDQILSALGLRVELAADGEAALAAAGARVFDVILMDVNMPGLDGLDATRRLRAQGPNRETPGDRRHRRRLPGRARGLPGGGDGRLGGKAVRRPGPAGGAGPGAEGAGVGRSLRNRFDFQSPLIPANAHGR
jgi:hypothetical protein